MTISATVPNARAAEANAILEEAGFGPNNFSVPVKQNPNAQATHKGLHAWNDAAFLEALLALAIPGMQITHDNSGNVSFGAHCEANNMTVAEEPAV